MKTEDPFAGRAEMQEDASGLVVRVRAKRHWGTTLFVGFWLCGWAMGELMAIGMLLSGTPGGHTLFIVCWLGAWTVGGVFAISFVLWNIAGQEVLRLSGSRLELERHIPFLRRRRAYDLTHVSNVRIADTDFVPVFGWRRRGPPGLFSDRGEGTIRIDYGVQTLGFGLDLDDAEARRIVERLQARLG